MFRILICLFTAMVCNAQTPVSPPLGVILDTDMATDVDDAAAIAVLAGLAKNGECELLAVTVGLRGTSHGPSAVQAMLTYNGMGDVPIGAVRDLGNSTDGSVFARPTAEAFGFKGVTRVEYPDALPVLRRALVDAPRNDNVVLLVGGLTTAAQLLASPADAISPLTGIELVEAKVARFVVMAGNFPTAVGDEYNVLVDPQACADFVSLVTVPCFWGGFGTFVNVFCSPSSDLNPEENVYRKAFASAPNLLNADGKRPSFDPGCALFAIRPQDPIWSLSAAGDINVYTGQVKSCDWTANPAGIHRYLRKEVSNAELGAILDSWIDEAHVEPYAPTGAPTISKAYAGAKNVRLSPVILPPGVSGLEYRVDGGVWMELPRSLIVPGLTPSSSHQIQVRYSRFGTPSQQVSNSLNVTTAATWHPLEILPNDGNSVFFDPSPTGVTEGIDGSGKGVINSPVGRLLDQSGNGVHAIAPEGARRGVLRRQNGIYHLEADGIDDYYNLGAGMDMQASNLSFCVGIRILNTTESNQSILMMPQQDGVHTSPFHRYGFLLTSDRRFTTRFNGVMAQSPPNQSVGGNLVMTYLTETATLRKDGIPVLDPGFAPGVVEYPNVAKMKLFANGAGEENIHCRLYALVSKSGTFTAAEMADIEAWMQARMGPIEPVNVDILPATDLDQDEIFEANVVVTHPQTAPGTYRFTGAVISASPPANIELQPVATPEPFVLQPGNEVGRFTVPARTLERGFFELTTELEITDEVGGIQTVTSTTEFLVNPLMSTLTVSPAAFVLDETPESSWGPLAQALNEERRLNNLGAYGNLLEYRITLSNESQETIAGINIPDALVVMNQIQQTIQSGSSGVTLHPIRFYQPGGEIDLTGSLAGAAVANVTLQPGESTSFAWVLDAVKTTAGLGVASEVEFTPSIRGIARDQSFRTGATVALMVTGTAQPGGEPPWDPATGFRITSLTPSADNQTFILGWNGSAESGSFRLQASTTLLPESWITFMELEAAPGILQSTLVTNPLPDESVLFFRVKMLPPD